MKNKVVVIHSKLWGFRGNYHVLSINYLLYNFCCYDTWGCRDLGKNIKRRSGAVRGGKLMRTGWQRKPPAMVYLSSSSDHEMSVIFC